MFTYIHTRTLYFKFISIPQIFRVSQTNFRFIFALVYRWAKIRSYHSFYLCSLFDWLIYLQITSFEYFTEHAHLENDLEIIHFYLIEYFHVVCDLFHLILLYLLLNLLPLTFTSKFTINLWGCLRHQQIIDFFVIDKSRYFVQPCHANSWVLPAMLKWCSHLITSSTI